MSNNTANQNKAEFMKRVADAMYIPLDNIRLADDEYEKLEWRNNPTIVDGVIDLILNGDLEARLTVARTMIENDKNKDDPLQVEVYNLLLDTYAHWVRRYINYHS